MPSSTDRQDPRTSRPPVPEMVGATSLPFSIGAEPTHIALVIHPPKGPARQPDETSPTSGTIKAKEVTLMVENLIGIKRAPPFKVYLNLPDGDPPERHPELLAGSLGLFGLVESSDISAGHGGNGLTFTLDITSLFDRLSQMTEWNPRVLKVSFVAASWDAPVPPVRVGRVSLYWQ